MSLIDREGTFRGIVVDRSVTESSGGYPQFELQLKANEYYDEDDQEWVNWSQVDEKDTTAWLILFDGKNRQTLSFKQIEKIFGWDGASFIDLNNIPFEGVELQFRVKKNIYEGNETYKVEWIDEHDASPGRTVRKLDADGLKALQAKYASKLKGKAPAKAPSKTPSKAPPKAPKKNPAPAPTISGKCTKEEAWNACLDKDLWIEGMTDEKLSQAWLNALQEIVPNKPDAKVTKEEWFQVKERVFVDILRF